MSTTIVQECVNGVNAIVQKQTNKLTSQEVFDRENKYGAHNYHPIPVAIDRGEGRIVINYCLGPHSTVHYNIFFNYCQECTFGMLKETNILTFCPRIPQSIKVTVIQELSKH
jgi:hypothetical protein